MPTPKKWNSLSKKLLPYWKIFAILSALSFLNILAIVFYQKNGNEIKNTNFVSIAFISSIIYFCSFGFLLVIAWFKKIVIYPDDPIRKYGLVKYKVRKFFEWYSSIFLSLYWVTVVFFTIIICRHFVFS
jgi:uncharacterized membrane protein YozB (DUF420 family)